MSRIFVVGSDRFSTNPGTGEVQLFREISLQVGAVLATRGHEVVVCSRDESTVDWWAVKGADQAAGDANQQVRVSFFVSDDELTKVKTAPYEASEFPNLDRNIKVTNGGWFNTYQTAIRNCDAVIAVGGSPGGTGAALYMALSQRKPVIGIPALGGAARDVWRDTESQYLSIPSEDRISLQGSASKLAAEAAVQTAETLISHSPFESASGARYLLYPLLMLILTTFWIVSTLLWSAPPLWLPYALAVAMSLAGMMLRYVIDAARDQEAYFGPAKVLKDTTRVFGLVLLAFLLVDWLAIQAGGGTIDGPLLRQKLLALLGFAAGYEVEEITGILSRSLTKVVDAILRRNP
jgi:hypothetical protein